MSFADNIVEFESLGFSRRIDDIRRFRLGVNDVNVYEVPEIVVRPKEFGGMSREFLRRGGCCDVVVR